MGWGGVGLYDRWYGGVGLGVPYVIVRGCDYQARLCASRHQYARTVNANQFLPLLSPIMTVTCANTSKSLFKCAMNENITRLDHFSQLTFVSSSISTIKGARTSGLPKLKSTHSSWSILACTFSRVSCILVPGTPVFWGVGHLVHCLWHHLPNWDDRIPSLVVPLREVWMITVSVLSCTLISFSTATRRKQGKLLLVSVPTRSGWVEGVLCAWVGRERFRLFRNLTGFLFSLLKSAKVKGL